MFDQEYIRSLAKEAELYRTQGLLEHSKEKYLQILQFIEKKQFSNHKKLIDAVKSRIRTVEEDLAVMDQETAAAEMSEEAQDMIKKLFSVAQTKKQPGSREPWLWQNLASMNEPWENFTHS